MAYLKLFPMIFTWWYSRGLVSFLDFMAVFFIHWTQVFSPLTILLNLFSPWKRLAGPKGRGLDALRDWFVDNFVSRLVGFVMRSVLLFIYFAFVVGYILFFIFGIFGWLFMPLVVVFSFLYIFRS